LLSASLYDAAYETYEAFGYAIVAASLLWSVANLVINFSYVAEGLVEYKQSFFSRRRGGYMRSMMLMLSIAQVRHK
jgi:hypothetical protein